MKERDPNAPQSTYTLEENGLQNDWEKQKRGVDAGECWLVRALVQVRDEGGCEPKNGRGSNNQAAQAQQGKAKAGQGTRPGWPAAQDRSRGCE
jgi:hypothetical protein